MSFTKEQAEANNAKVAADAERARFAKANAKLPQCQFAQFPLCPEKATSKIGKEWLCAKHAQLTHDWVKITDRTGISEEWTHICQKCGNVTDNPKFAGKECKDNYPHPQTKLHDHKTDRQISNPESESSVRHDAVRAPSGKETDANGLPGRVMLNIVSFRRRLLDPDNPTPKYFIDALRYMKLIRDDTSEHIELSMRQVKVKIKSEERTEIEITTP